MELKVSRPIQILVLILVLAGIGGVASMSMLGKSSPSAGAQLSVAQIRARAHGGATTSAPKTTATVAHTAAATPRTKPQTKTPVQTKPPVVKVPASTPVTKKPETAALPSNGLPPVLNAALQQHRIVVVSIFDPQDQTDAIDYAEARAGASDVNAGFLGVSVLDDTVTAPLTSALPGGGLLPVPGLLVYRRPGTLVGRLDGFADRDTVAQLIIASYTAPPLTAPATTATTTTP